MTDDREIERAREYLRTRRDATLRSLLDALDEYTRVLRALSRHAGPIAAHPALKSEPLLSLARERRETCQQAQASLQRIASMLRRAIAQQLITLDARDERKRERRTRIQDSAPRATSSQGTRKPPRFAADMLVHASARSEMGARRCVKN